MLTLKPFSSQYSLLIPLKGTLARQGLIPGGSKKSYVFKRRRIFPYFVTDCYSPSLIPLKPFSRSDDIEASLEAQTFCQQNIETLVPFTDYVNNFYVYPISLNFNSQKMFKVRTLH